MLHRNVIMLQLRCLITANLLNCASPIRHMCYVSCKGRTVPGLSELQLQCLNHSNFLTVVQLQLLELLLLLCSPQIQLRLLLHLVDYCTVRDAVLLSRKQLLLQLLFRVTLAHGGCGRSRDANLPVPSHFEARRGPPCCLGLVGFLQIFGGVNENKPSSTLIGLQMRYQSLAIWNAPKTTGGCLSGV